MQLLTNKLKMLFAKQYFDSFKETSDSTYHIVGADIGKFEGEAPLPKESIYETSYKIHDSILFGKRINPDDTSYMFRNIPWVSGTTYNIYDDKDNEIGNKNFFVSAEQDDGSYGVFKLIYKEIEQPSLYKPITNQTTPGDEIYITGDGYHWKFMFSIDSVSYDKFATEDYIPVVEDSAVIGSAVSGTIDAIITENAGAEYNNYAFGNIKEINYGGNTLKLSLSSDNVFAIKTYDLLYTSNGEFSVGDTVSITVPGDTPVEADVYKTGPSSISFEVNSTTELITQADVLSSNSNIEISSNTVSADVITIRNEKLPKLSVDNNFYNNSVLYIRGGTGVGQIKTITEYEVIGNDRVVTINEAFSTTPNSTSKFSILPKVNIEGDGSGAIGLVDVDPSANSITNVRVINRGSDYTFANATISGNSGIISSGGEPVINNPSEIRPIIAPIGGHGSNPKEELFASNIGISVKFDQDEVMHEDISFSKIAIIRNLLHNNIQLTVDSLVNGDYSLDEVISQENTKSRGTISEIDDVNNVITLTDVFGNFVSTSNNNIIGSSTNSSITDINRSTDIFDNDLKLNITPIISNFTEGEIVKQANSNASGLVLKASPSIINIIEVFGTFATNASDVLVGETSGARSFITSVEPKRLVDNSGDIVYIENFNGYDRSDVTSEQIKLIFKF